MGRLVIFDGDQLPFISCMGNKVLDESGEPIKENNKFVYTPKTLEEVYSSVDSLIQSLLTKANCFNYIGFLGVGKNFRHEVKNTYKANRVNLEKPLFFKECREYLVSKYNFNLVEGIESDDAISITRNLLKETYKVLVVTSDKDLIRCTPGNYLNIRNQEIIHTNEIQANYEFWSSMITGDAVDGILCLKGKGRKYVEKLFEFKFPNLLRDIVFNEYIKYYGEYRGIEEFVVSYKLLKLLEEQEGFILPKIQKYEYNN